MSANRNDRVVDHATGCGGQWNAITTITRLTGEYPELVSPPSRTQHAKFSVAPSACPHAELQRMRLRDVQRRIVKVRNYL
jgi:hypothetical protein